MSVLQLFLPPTVILYYRIPFVLNIITSLLQVSPTSFLSHKAAHAFIGFALYTKKLLHHGANAPGIPSILHHILQKPSSLTLKFCASCFAFLLFSI